MIFENRTKIIFTTDTIKRGGKERQLFFLTKSLLCKDFQIRIITRTYSPENYLNEFNLDHKLVKVYGGKSWLKEFQCFRQVALTEKPDYIVSWDFQSSLFAQILHRKHKFKFINASIQHGIRLLRVSNILRSIICFISPYIIANSLAGLKANNLKPGKRRFVLYNGIETKFRNDLTKSAIEDVRKKLIPGYDENPGFVYISVANFVPYKDYFTVFKTLNRLKEDLIFYYLILGDGPMRGEIEKKISAFGLEKRVILVGRTENVRNCLFASDVMIHSSRGEGISNAILEGMYAGLPIIATNVGGVPETVFPSSSMLFPYKNHKALYQCLLKSRELKASFDPGSEEYQNHLSKFSVDAMVNKFEEIIRTATKDNKD